MTDETEYLRKREPFFCSWSGGKDSCLALHRSVAVGAVPKKMLTIIREDGAHSMSHHIPIKVLKAQADSLNIELITKPATWGEYERVYIETLHDIRAEGVTAGVFGDIDLVQHLEWEEKVCKAADLKPCLPLWKEERQELLSEFLALGYKAMIVTINTKMLDEGYLGEMITPELVDEFEDIGIDPCGENGEYHTVVFDGPLFSKELTLEKRGCLSKDEYVFLDFALV